MRPWAIIVGSLGIALAGMVNSQGASAAVETAGPVTLAPAQGASIKIDAHFAPHPTACPAKQKRNLHAAYGSKIQIGKAKDGKLFIVSEMTFENYLKGIAEVPRSWPIEALKTQVVAARTYAMSHMNPNSQLARDLGFNICSTDACQVFRGLGVERGAWGDRWSAAVTQTTGEILRYQGKPANTFFFSTSDGHTYTNADAFGGSALAYLKPVIESDDGSSPYSHWKVRMPLADLTESLRRAGVWKSGNIEQVTASGSDVQMSNAGQTLKMTLDDLRKKLNANAVCLEPKRYPTLGSDGRNLPETIPSRWMGVTTDGPDAVFEGRGWGHGVGMVQYGAKGKADRSMSYSDILAFYYAGLRPQAVQEPSVIRVLIATGIDKVVIERQGEVKTDGAVLPDGPTELTASPAGVAVWKAPKINPVFGLTEVAMIGPSKIGFTLSNAALVSLEVRRKDVSAAKQVVQGPVPMERGMQAIEIDKSTLGSGSYDVDVLTTDGVDEVRSQSFTFGSTGPSPTPSNRRQGAPRSGRSSAGGTNRSPKMDRGLVVAALVLVGGALAMLVGWRIRSTRRYRN
ncbi:MAG: SpoIID/LytB domain-containing protein [Actinomycetota bacterium]